MNEQPRLALLDADDDFVRRHIGPSAAEVEDMLAAVGVSSLEALMEQVIPAAIRTELPLSTGAPLSEADLWQKAQAMAGRNSVLRSFIGCGYHSTITPPIIQRNILENPGWYTQYTPYQPEIAQGRLEALLNFQTMVEELTGMEVANASLLDEATAAAEAMTMVLRISKKAPSVFFVDESVHPQTLAVMQTRAQPLGIEVRVGDVTRTDFVSGEVAGLLVQVPATDGRIVDHRALVERAHAAGMKVVVAVDLLSLVLLEGPGSWGADIVVGNTQRFGVPMGFGGPHAAFLACRKKDVRKMPGRLVGVTKDATGASAMRLALTTREQHIRRGKATSNICTAQVLLAIMAGMYAVYHGPDGLKRIAGRVQLLTDCLARGLTAAGWEITEGPRFDTVAVRVDDAQQASLAAAAVAAGMNLRLDRAGWLGISLDETHGPEDVGDLLAVFGDLGGIDRVRELAAASVPLDGPLTRKGPCLTHGVFRRYHAEHEMLRYIHRLEMRDLSLNTSMIPLGSCTMKLNATTEMLPVSLPGFSSVHPFAPTDQVAGYHEMLDELRAQLVDVTGFPGISLMPNAGSQGEYTGLLVIRAYHLDRGDGARRVCLIPNSAHGTNPASSAMAGMKVVAVRCDEQGNIDLEDLRAKAVEHRDQLAALMVTYPSTHGVFEEAIQEICEVVHANGGLVYMDGANMNAQVGLTRPAEIGADVVHLNLHKTFCIPHGGGGPGMGPIGVTAALAPYLPGHPLVPCGGEKAIGPVSAAPFGSPSILPISWAYIHMMGQEGLTEATRVAILSANYVAVRLQDHFPVLYTGSNGRVAHECILDMRSLKASAGIQVTDIAKRLMDYGYHAPTMAWPVAGTMMVEPTESESKHELDRFIAAMVSIRAEIARVEAGELSREDNPLVGAPHTAAAITDAEWDRSYSRVEAVYPAPWTREHKYWPTVARVDDAFGDRNLVCSCPPMEAWLDG